MKQNAKVDGKNGIHLYDSRSLNLYIVQCTKCIRQQQHKVKAISEEGNARGWCIIYCIFAVNMQKLDSAGEAPAHSVRRMALLTLTSNRLQARRALFLHRFHNSFFVCLFCLLAYIGIRVLPLLN